MIRAFPAAVTRYGQSFTAWKHGFGNFHPPFDVKEGISDGVGHGAYRWFHRPWDSPEQLRALWQDAVAGSRSLITEAVDGSTGEERSGSGWLASTPWR